MFRKAGPPRTFVFPTPVFGPLALQVMLKTLGLEPCQTYHKSFPNSDGHSSCLHCLRDTHVPSKCQVCTGFKGRSWKDRDVQMECSLVPVGLLLYPPHAYIGLNVLGCSGGCCSSSRTSRGEKPLFPTRETRRVAINPALRRPRVPQEPHLRFPPIPVLTCQCCTRSSMWRNLLIDRTWRHLPQY